jgi:hypothetical protein
MEIPAALKPQRLSLREITLIFVRILGSRAQVTPSLGRLSATESTR